MMHRAEPKELEQCEFGPDGFLYVGLGDGGLANDPLLQAQNPNSPLGHSDGKCSITGGYVYRNGDPDNPENLPTIPEIYGKYVFGEYCEGTIWALAQNEQGDWESEVLVSTGLALGISSFGVDEEGEIYVAHLGIGVPDVGKVFKLVPADE